MRRNENETKTLFGDESLKGFYYLCVKNNTIEESYRNFCRMGFKWLGLESWTNISHGPLPPEE